MPSVKGSGNGVRRRRPPAMTIEDREDQLISLAIDLAEKKLMDGTASNQVITHYLKLGTTRERLEKEKLQRENELLKAKTDSLESAKDMEKLYRGAISAMSEYRGLGSDEEDSYEYEE